MIPDDPHFRKFCETDEFILGHVYERAYLISKRGSGEIHMGDFYGDPYCGLIDSNNYWCLTGGNKLCIWIADEGGCEIEDDELSWICKVRQKSTHEAELLIDPWSDIGSIWTLNVKTRQRHKIRDYRLSGEYSDHIEW